ncbi:MAG: hypothetical protein ACKVKT_02705 [Rhodospirillales bacterium]
MEIEITVKNGVQTLAFPVESGETDYSTLFNIIPNLKNAPESDRKAFCDLLLKSGDIEKRAIAVSFIDDLPWEDDEVRELVNDGYMEVLNVLVTTARFRSIANLAEIENILTKEIIFDPSNSQYEWLGEPEEYQIYDSRANIAGYCAFFEGVTDSEIAKLVIKQCPDQDFVLLELARGTTQCKEVLNQLAVHKNEEISEAAKGRLNEIEEFD